MPRIGVVLGAGGIVGQAFHIGVLSALADVGWDARRSHTIVGTSAGSMIAACLRAGVAPDELETLFDDRGVSSARRLREPPPKTTPLGPDPLPSLVARALVRPGSVRPATLLAAAAPPGGIGTSAIEDGIASLYGGTRWPADDLAITAVRLDTGRRVVFGRGDAPAVSVGTAVAASCAVPGIIRAVSIDGAGYVDGGAWSPTNADVLTSGDIDVVVVSSPMSVDVTSGLPRGADGLVRAGCGVVLALELAALRRAGIPIVRFEPSLADIRVMGRAFGPEALDPARGKAVVQQLCASTLDRLSKDDAFEQVARAA